MALASTVLNRGSRIAHISAAAVEIALKRSKVKADSDLGKALTISGKTSVEEDLAKFRQNHPFLEYAAKHWITHSTRFQKARSSTWDFWLHMVMGGSSLAHRPWNELLFQQVDHPLLIWSHQTHHYAVLRHAVSNAQLQETTINMLTEISAAGADDEALAVFLETGTCSMQCINNALQKASNGGHIEVVE